MKRRVFNSILSVSLVALMLIQLCLMSACGGDTEQSGEAPAKETEAETESVRDTAPDPTSKEEDGRIEVVRLIKDVRQGEMLSAECLITSLTDPAHLPTGAIVEYDDVIGKFAKSDLSAGAFLLPTDLSIVEVEYLPEMTPPDEEEARSQGYLIVTDYIDPTLSDNLAPAINELILANPNRTIFFPDGEYYISEPIMTPANPVNSVSLYLSNYAVIKASEDWDSEEAMIRLGAAEPYNSIYINGSNYYMYGGIIDGSGIANGVSIDSGRETSVRFVSIKNTPIGLHIKHGANGGSSDSDIDTVNIVGTNERDSIGVLIEGYDNTVSNMRIAKVQIGVKIVGGGNFLRNLHPLMTYGDIGFDYKDCIGFWDISGSNFFDFCYSDQFAIGFRLGSNSRSVYQSCFCFWYTTKAGESQYGFKSDGNFNAIISTTRVAVRSDCVDTAYLKIDGNGGNGIIQYPLCNDNNITDKTYKDFLVDKVIPY